ncbi:MAG: hypothetical protein JWM68_2176, partial [Verrucomicrobiales bacterium]|nr:hypothetical protein [Verrucomicrobiales bacterium]
MFQAGVFHSPASAFFTGKAWWAAKRDSFPEK